MKSHKHIHFLAFLVLLVELCSSADHSGHVDAHNHPEEHEHSMHSSINDTEKVFEGSSSVKEISYEKDNSSEPLNGHHDHSDGAHQKHGRHTDSMHMNHGEPPMNHARNDEPPMNHAPNGELSMMHDQAAPSHNMEKHEHDHKDHAKAEHMNPQDMDAHMNMNGSGKHMMMKMWFHTGIDEVVLFEQWKIKSDGGMIASMVGIILLAMFYEGLKFFREYLFKQYLSSLQFSTVAVTGESGQVTQLHKVQKNKILSLAHAVQTGLHMLQIVMSYFLMLIFMTYNIWLCLSVVLGAGIGYFIFGWKKATVVDITEHCH